jgi:hypothetical protein
VSPEPASYDPEEFVDGSQPWPRLLAFKDGELLAKGEVFEHQTAARPKPAKHGSEPEPKQVKHGDQVIADRLCRLPDEVIDFTAGQDCGEGQDLEAIGLLAKAIASNKKPSREETLRAKRAKEDLEFKLTWLNAGDEAQPLTHPSTAGLFEKFSGIPITLNGGVRVKDYNSACSWPSHPVHVWVLMKY